MPIIIFPVMGGAIRISQESVQRAVVGASFAVYTDDEGFVTEAFLEYLYRNNTVVPIEAASLEDALRQFQETDSNALIYIPRGYNDNLTQSMRGELRVYANLRKLNMAETQSTNIVSSLINVYNYYFSISKIRRLLEQTGGTGAPEAIRSPISIRYASILKGTVLDIPPTSIISLVMSQSIMLPIMVMMMVMFAIQMAATSIALEKEQKTLETLMTLPVSRLTVLAGKLSGSMVIFVTLVSALAMALSIAVFADNVRSAQSFTGILITPIMIPAIILMFSDIDMLPQAVQWILLVIPYTHSIIATKAAFLGDYFVVIRSIAFISVWTFVVLYVAAKIFSTERIITARFTLGDIGKRFKRGR